MEENCINCGIKFEKRNKGFRRKSIDCFTTKFSSLTLRDILDQTLSEPLTPGNKFMCDKCASLCVKIQKTTVASKSEIDDFCNKQKLLGQTQRKRKCGTPISTPAKNRVYLTSTPINKLKNPKVKIAKTSSTKLFLNKAADYLKKSKYDALFQTLYKKSKYARKSISKFVKKCVKSEICKLKGKNTVFERVLNKENLSSFSWENAFKELDANLPLLTSAVQGALTTRKHKSPHGDDKGQLLPGYGFLLSTLLYLRNPYRYNFLQRVTAVELYKSGCNQKILKWFQKLGWCVGVNGTRATIDRLCQNFDSEILQWKEDIQKDIDGSEDSEEIMSDLSAINIENSSDDSSLDLETTTSNDTDNTSDVSSDNVDIGEFSDEVGDFSLNAQDVSIPETGSSLNSKEKDPGYSVCWDNVQKLSLARHQLKQGNKMMLWALCFAAKNRISFQHLDDNDTRPATEIGLQNFLPDNTDWDLLKNRMEVVTENIIIQNFPAFGNMEKKVIHHQYTEESRQRSSIVNLGVIQENPASAKGTIEIMKFLHQYVPIDATGKPYSIICHGDQLSVERMVEAKLAMAYSENPADQLAGLIPRPQGFHKRCIILQDSMNMLFSGQSIGSRGSLMQIKNRFRHRNVKRKISDCINHVVDFFDFVTESYVCLLVCKILQIDSVDEVPNDIPADIQDREKYLLDLAQKVVATVWPTINLRSVEEAGDSDSFDETIPYFDETSEDVDETFVGNEDGGSSDGDDGQINKDTAPVISSNSQDSVDSVLQYSCAVVWRGLTHMVQKNAERENDGLLMLSDWRLDMLDFWNLNHNKYLILGHRLLSAVNGWLPSKIAEEITWNSTANLVGKPGHNLALDLVNEFLNNDFKENLKNCHGQYTESQIPRCSKLVGTVGKDLERVFQTNIVHNYISKSKSSGISNKESVKKFIAEYKDDNLFTEILGRHHNGFENFSHTVGIKNPQKLKERLLKYSELLESEDYLY